MLMKKFGDRFPIDELRTRACKRVAVVLHGIWEEGGLAHTRIFDTLVWHQYITVGKSKDGAEHKEHLVPCAVIRDIANAEFENGASTEEVATIVERLLKVAYISKSERHKIDFELGLKTRMPAGWDYRNDSVYARLDTGGVELERECFGRAGVP